jgi:hypothetical protein
MSEARGAAKPPTVADFVASDSPFLCKEQIAPYGVVRGIVERVSRESVPVAGTGRSEPRFVIWFRGWKKGMVVGSRRNRKFLAELWGGTNCSAWAGRAIWLYVDPGATFAGKRVGGIRFAWGERYSGETVGPPKPTPTDAPGSGPGVDPSDTDVPA